MFRPVSTSVPAQVRLVAYLLGGAGVVLELVAFFVFSHLSLETSAPAAQSPPAMCQPMSRGPVISLPSLELAL